MKGDLAVALGGELVTTGAQSIANLAIAVELAVDDQMDGAIRTGHRLLTVVEADDGQARVAERPPAVARRPAARTVRPAMLQGPEGRVPTFRREPATCHCSEDSAHQMGFLG